MCIATSAINVNIYFLSRVWPDHISMVLRNGGEGLARETSRVACRPFFV